MHHGCILDERAVRAVADGAASVPVSAQAHPYTGCADTSKEVLAVVHKRTSCIFFRTLLGDCHYLLGPNTRLPTTANASTALPHALGGSLHVSLD